MNSIVQTALQIAAPASRRPAQHLWILALVLAAIVGGALLAPALEVPVDLNTIAIVGP